MASSGRREGRDSVGAGTAQIIAGAELEAAAAIGEGDWPSICRPQSCRRRRFEPALATEDWMKLLRHRGPDSGGNAGFAARRSPASPAGANSRLVRLAGLR